MTAAAPRRRAPAMTRAQQRAIFAAGRRAGLSLDDLRAMTPAGSVSRLTLDQAAALLTRLNAGTAHARDADHFRGPGKMVPDPSRPRPRRPAGVYAMVTPGQRLLIDHLRLELGWPPAQLSTWLAQRHYRSDPARPMSRMDSSADAIAVIELLKAVRDRTYLARERAAGRPHTRQLDTLNHVKARLRAARRATQPGESAELFDAWWRDLRLPNGAYLCNIATAAECSQAIDIATRELDRALRANKREAGVSPVQQEGGM